MYEKSAEFRCTCQFRSCVLTVENNQTDRIPEPIGCTSSKAWKGRWERVKTFYEDNSVKDGQEE